MNDEDDLFEKLDRLGRIEKRDGRLVAVRFPSQWPVTPAGAQPPPAAKRPDAHLGASEAV